MRKLLTIALLGLFVAASAQQEGIVGESNLDNSDYIKKTYGTEAVRYFKEILWLRYDSKFISQYSKVSMYQLDQFIDTLRLRDARYFAGGNELLYALPMSFINSFLAKSCTGTAGKASAQCLSNLKQFLFLTRDEWMLQRFSAFSKKGNTVLLKTGVSDENWTNYILLDKNGLPVNSKLYMFRIKGGDTSGHVEILYEYNANKLVKETISRYSRFYGPSKLWQTKEKIFDTTGKLLRAITTEWEYAGTKDEKVNKTEEKYTYLKDGRFSEEEYIRNGKLVLTYSCEYNENTVDLYMRPVESDGARYLYSYRWIK
jgi:hypothetical protein